MTKNKEIDKTYKDVLNQLASNVKYIRTKKLKESQEAFAHNCGTTLKVISWLERAKGSDVHTVAKIAVYTKQTVSQLFG